MTSESVAAVATAVGLIVLIGNGFFFMGILWGKANRNREDISTIFSKLDRVENKIDAVGRDVRNGRKP